MFNNVREYTIDIRSSQSQHNITDTVYNFFFWFCIKIPDNFTVENELKRILTRNNVNNMNTLFGMIPNQSKINLNDAISTELAVVE